MGFLVVGHHLRYNRTFVASSWCPTARWAHGLAAGMNEKHGAERGRRKPTVRYVAVGLVEIKGDNDDPEA